MSCQPLNVLRVDLGELFSPLAPARRRKEIGPGHRVLGMADFRQRHSRLHEAVVDLQLFEHLLDERHLVGRVVDDEVARQPDGRRFAAEQAGAEGVERRDPRPGERRAQQRLDAGAHFFRSLVRERDGKNFVVLRVAFRQQIADSLRDDAGLTRTGAGKDQERAVDVKDGVALFGIESRVSGSDRCLRTLLFYRDALREIARLVDIAAAPDGDVIRQQLQRQYHRDRREHFGDARQGDDRVLCGIQHAFQRVVALGRDGDHRSASSLHFLNIAKHLLENVIIWCNAHDGHVAVDERDRPVLHLAGRVAFGVDVRNFLQLQRAFEGDRVVDAPAEEQKIAPVGKARRNLFDDA